MADRTDVSRRRFLLTSVGAASGAAAAGHAAAQEGNETGGGQAGGNETGGDGGGNETGGGDGGGGGGEPDYGGWFSDVDNFDGTQDATGQDQVSATVGAEGNGGAFAFEPAAVHVDNGATVHWEWTGEGGQHNVVEDEGVFSSGDPVAEAGTTYEYTFDQDGIYMYVCEPHEDLGMKGAVVVGTDYPTTGGGAEGGSSVPSVPDSAKSLGVGAAIAMGSTLGLAYFFLKYGGDYAGETEA